MKVLMINVVCGIRSTGRICTDLATELEKQGHQVKIAYGRENVPELYQKYAVHIGSELGVKLHGVKARLLDGCGFGSRKATEKFIEWVKEYDPDVIHLHNLHGYYINLEVLFEYLRTCGRKIIWTLHDCWAFTGHCAYFDYVGCKKWKNRCEKCPQKREYPSCVGIDNSEKNYQRKKALFSGINNLTLVTPSIWLANLISQSFLKDYPIQIINNGIDVDIFKPTQRGVIEKYNLPNKKIILGVAALWEKRKGIDTFYELAKELPEEYQVVLVGLSKTQMKAIPSNIIGIERTDSAEELAALYSIAEVFVNPTLEDNYPTTNLESICCGTPVITYRTGGSPESASAYGIAIPSNNVRGILDIIVSDMKFKRSNKCFDKNETVKNYLKLYRV